LARRRLGKRVALALLPAAASTVAVLAGAGTAGADTTSTTHTFEDGSGIFRTCTVAMTRTIPFGGDGQVGQGGTSVTGGAACGAGVNAFIGATYNDPDGEPAFTLENSDGVSTFRRYAPVGDSFVTFHHVDFTGSPAGCSADCSLKLTRTK
jgi:hypothetical protein